LGFISGQNGVSQIEASLPDRTQSGINLAMGIHLQSGADAALQATIGYESLSLGSDRALIFRRVPVELISSLRVAPQLWLGWGLRRAVKAEISGADQPAHPLTSNTGLVLEATLPISLKPAQHPTKGRIEHDTISLRYIRESYRDTASGRSLDGFHIGLFMQGYWE
jgi:hypothetical protein